MIRIFNMYLDAFNFYSFVPQRSLGENCVGLFLHAVIDISFFQIVCAINKDKNDKTYKYIHIYQILGYSCIFFQLIIISIFVMIKITKDKYNR